MNAQNVNEILNTLSARFGATGTHLWEVLIFQQQMWGWSAVLVFPILSLLTLGYFLWAKKKSGYEEFGIFIFGLAWAFAFFSIVLEGIPRIINPEYYALMDLLGR